jgi:predicted phage baseplate assembly protein
MSLPEPNLDDLRFQQDLVDEARRRIVRYCPEWTDYNVSDPGITLIELFAWMTEKLIYRLNQVPAKNYIKFLDMVGVELTPASSARTELTFRLSIPFPISPDDETVAIVPQGTEVATQRIEDEEPIIFTTDERLVIRPIMLTQVRRDCREDDFNRNYLSRLGGAEVVYAFNRQQPQEGDTFYLGFEATEPISGHILQLNFETRPTQAVGIRRDDPPWVWECSLGDGEWQAVPLSTYSGEQDTTGGLNNARGRLILYLPLAMRPDLVHDVTAYWVRCRLRKRPGEEEMYAESPRIITIHPQTLGAAVPATHAVVVEHEILGRSDGNPGQLFTLPHAPILEPLAGERVEVEEYRDGELVFFPWQKVDDFSASTHYDRHFAVDTATGEVSFGPNIRQPDGKMKAYGRVPPAGHRIRFSRYRYGGGVRGNLPENKIVELRSAIPYIDSVVNRKPAFGGRDQERLEEAMFRARREMRSQQRAITAEDYEHLAKNASRAVARVKCMTAGSGNGSLPPGMIELLLVPAVVDELRARDLSALHVDPFLRQTISDYLDQYRLLTTTLSIREPRYLGIKVEAEIVISDFSRPEVVQQRVTQALRNFISPLALELPVDDQNHLMPSNWEGWPFGKALYLSEVYALIQQVPGVKHVVEVQLSQRPIIPGREAGAQDEAVEEEENGSGLARIEQRRLNIPPDTLLCSLDHEARVVTL